MADCIIGIPTFADRPPCFQFIMALTSIAMPINFSNQYHIVVDKRIDDARNEIVEGVLANDSKPRFLFFLDDDVIMPPDTLRKFIHKMDNLPVDVGAISGVYFTKSAPAEPLIFMSQGHGSYYDWRVGDFFKAWASGCGLTLIRAEALRRMEMQAGRPWFAVDYGLHKTDKGALEARSITEDLYFYEKMRKTIAPNGKPYSLWIDTSVQGQHYEKNTKQFFGLRPEEPQAQGRKPLKTDEALELAWIGCGPYKHEFPGCRVVRIDELSEFGPDVVSPGNLLPFDGGRFDVIYSAHLLHVYPPSDTVKVLREWARILKPGGRIFVKVPDIDEAIKATATNPDAAIGAMYGGKTGFNATLARLAFTRAGYKDIWTFTDRGELNVYATRE